MNKKHTNFIVIVLAIVFIRAYGDIKYLYNNITNVIDNNLQFPIILLVTGFISLLVGIIYFRKLYYLKKNVYTWTNIFFGYTSLEDTFFLLILFVTKTQDPIALNTMLVMFLTKLAIWPIFFKYLKNKESSGKIMLS